MILNDYKLQKMFLLEETQTKDFVGIINAAAMTIAHC